MRINHKVSIDFARNTPVHLEIPQSGSNSTTLEFFPLDNGNPIDLKEIGLASVKATTSAGAIIFNDVSEIGENSITYLVSNTIMSQVGKTVCVLQIFNKEEILINSFEFYIEVMPGLYDEESLLTEDDLSGFRSYAMRAVNAAESCETLSASLEALWTTMEELADDCEDTIKEVEDALEDLASRIAGGEFIGARGAQGENGANGVIADGEGFIGFEIIKGDLYCFYASPVEPELEMDGDGNLCYLFGEGETNG